MVVAPVSWSAVGSQGQCRPQAVCGRHAVLGSSRNTKRNRQTREVLERAVTFGQESPAIATFAPTIDPKLRFLLRQDRTVLYPPLVRSFLLRRFECRIHRRDAEGAEEMRRKIATDKADGHGRKQRGESLAFAFIRVHRLYPPVVPNAGSPQRRRGRRGNAKKNRPR